MSSTILTVRPAGMPSGPGKPVGNRGWDCIWGTKSLIAGFPHLYYYSNPEAAGRFLQTCAAFRAGKREDLTRDE